MKPIIFKTAMVQAILDGRKTETRCLNGLEEINKNPDDWSLQDLCVDPELMRYNEDGEEVIFVKKGLIATFEHNEFGECYRNIKLPYQVGDVLYVRETWAKVSGGIVVYKADYKEPFTGSPDIDHVGNRIKWRSPRFMSRAAARLFLRVTEVRVERLQEITEEGAKAEGVDFCCPSQRHAWWNNRWISGYCHDCDHHSPMTGKRNCYYSAGKEDETRFQWWCGCSSDFKLRDDTVPEPYRFKFAFVWDELGKPPFWNQNPWIQVVKFERALASVES